MARRIGLVVGLAGVALGLTAEWVRFGWADPRHWLPDLAVGWTYIGCGLVASRRRAESRTGALMAATGFTWFVGNFANVGAAAVAWLAAHLVYLYRGPLVQLALTYPSGRPASRLVRGAVAVGYTAAVITPIWDSEAATIVLAGLLLAVCAREYGRSVGPSRRARLIGLQAAAGLSLVLAGTAAARLLLAPEEVSGASLLIYEAALCMLAGALLAGLLVAPWQQTAVADLVVELGEARSGTVRGQLARALGDPSLEIGYWLPDRVAVVAYFVCAEALTNTAKHAAAARVITVAVIVSDGQLRVEIADDGVGGADPAGGSGLRGLVDRVETIGGTLQVQSVPRHGTRLAADIPLGGPAT
jgi:Histidine kinase-, DNA gyrase B-, and HSP90-like ATPase